MISNAHAGLMQLVRQRNGKRRWFDKVAAADLKALLNRGRILGQQAEAMEGSTGSTRSSPQKIRLFSGPGTRRWPRFDISDVPSIAGVSSETGSRIKVVNISQGGALLQTAERAALR